MIGFNLMPDNTFKSVRKLQCKKYSYCILLILLNTVAITDENQRDLLHLLSRFRNLGDILGQYLYRKFYAESL